MSSTSRHTDDEAADLSSVRTVPERPSDPAGRPGRAAQSIRRYFGRTRSPLWFELLVIAWLCWLYDDINNLSPLRRSLAYGNGRLFLHIERVLHLDPEAALDHWLAGHPALGWIAGNYYDNVHFVTTLGLIGLVWWKFPERYRPLRNGLVLTNLAAMVIFWLVPTAPPRLLDPSVYIDVVGQSHSFGSWHTGTLATAANQLAAMPSMHIGWAAWSALAAWRILPRRWWTGLVWIYPVITAVDVMATGNHYLSDVVAGALLFALCQVVADRWQGWSTAREARRALVRPPSGGARAGSVATLGPSVGRVAGYEDVAEA